MAYDMVDFQKDVLEACKTVPVVIDFWAPWCGPCRVLSPVIEKLANEAKGAWKLVKINTDEHPQIAAQFRIQGIPAVKMVYEGRIVAEFTGALSEPQIRQWLKQYLPTNAKVEDVTATLQDILATEDRKRARATLEKLVKADTSNKDLRAKLAMLYLPSDVKTASQLMKDLDESKYEIEREAINTIQHLNQLNKEGVPPASNPAVAEYYRKAISALLKEDMESALNWFIQVIMLDRAYDDDGARKACVAIFAALSEHHPISKNWRRRFSMALY
jgi:putative thioredoxin